MRLRTVAAGCGTVAVVLLFLAGCGIARLYEELPAGEHPDVDFQNTEISAARAAIVPELEAQLEAMERRFGTGRVGDRIRTTGARRDSTTSRAELSTPTNAGWRSSS
jgi:hypothetical protein